MLASLKGARAEAKAAKYLRKLGFTVIEQNFHSKMGEIDIIASKDNVTHFVEVKSGESFEPVYNITPAKLQKIIKTLNYYMKVKNLDTPYCIDACIVQGNTIEWIENITL